MKFLLIISCLLASIELPAQKQAASTESFTVEGAVKQPITFSLKDMAELGIQKKDSLVITNHLLERKSVLHNIQAVLLKDLLSKVIIDQDNPKLLSEYYLVCKAADNYKVVFSWNELFNSETGNNACIITGYDGKTGAAMDNRIALVVFSDKATGRRYVKGLQKIIIKRAE